MIKKLLLRFFSSLLSRLYKVAFLLGICLVAWFFVLRPEYLPRLNDMMNAGLSIYGKPEERDSDSIKQLRLQLIRDAHDRFYMEQK